MFLDRINRIFRIAVDVITMFEARTCTPTILTILLILSDDLPVSATGMRPSGFVGGH